VDQSYSSQSKLSWCWSNSTPAFYAGDEQTSYQHPTLVPVCETKLMLVTSNAGFFSRDFKATTSRALTGVLFNIDSAAFVLGRSFVLQVQLVQYRWCCVTLRTPCWMSDRVQVQKLPQVKSTAVGRNFNLRLAGFVLVLRKTTWPWKAPVNFTL